MDADDLGHDPADFGGCVELALALAALDGEVPDEVLAGVARDVVAVGAVLREIQRWVLKDRYQVREPVDHLSAIIRKRRFLNFTPDSDIIRAAGAVIRPIIRGISRWGELFPLYTLRHMCLTRCAPFMDPWTLAYLAGHRDMSITKRCVHPQEYNTRAAIEKPRLALSGHNSGHSPIASTETPIANLALSN